MKKLVMAFGSFIWALAIFLNPVIATLGFTTDFPLIPSIFCLVVTVGLVFSLTLNIYKQCAVEDEVKETE